MCACFCHALVAALLQSSEVFATDIHPAACIGYGVMLDHASGVVIGETARVGNNVSILQVCLRHVVIASTQAGLTVPGGKCSGGVVV